MNPVFWASGEGEKSPSGRVVITASETEQNSDSLKAAQPESCRLRQAFKSLNSASRVAGPVHAAHFKKAVSANAKLSVDYHWVEPGLD